MENSETRTPAKIRKIENHYTIGQPIGTSLTRSIDGELPDPYVHIFNFEDEEGFAIVSGDKRTPSVLAITEKGNLFEDTVIDNPGLIIFLSNMENLYYQHIEEDEEVPVTDLEPGTGSTAKIEYSPWEQTLYGTQGKSFNDWGQSSSPYNDYIPQIDGLAPHAGCVATATAIIMAFHKHPTYSNEYSYNWDEMVKHRPMRTYTDYPHAYSQIARLFQQLGLPRNLDMQYGLDGSSSNTKKVPQTLKNFGYSNGGIATEFKTQIALDELKSGYAVVAGGSATIEKKKILGIAVKRIYRGHAWVIDRVMYRYRTKKTLNNKGIVIKTETESEHLVRCNFGWEGLDNGYYYAGAFDTNKGPVTTTRSGTPGNYQYKLKMVYNIRK